MKFAVILNKDIGALSGLAGLASEERLKRETLLLLKGLTGKVESELGGFEKELNVKFEINDDFKASVIMADDEAAYWEAALSGTKVKMAKIAPSSGLKKAVREQKPCVCVASLKNLKLARKIKKCWPFMPVMVYGELTDKFKEKLSREGLLAVSAYSTADDMFAALCAAAKYSPALPEYWDKIKLKSRWARPAAAAAALLLFAAGFAYMANPQLADRLARVSTYAVPYSQPSNITFGGSSLWGCDWFGQSIYKHDPGRGLKLMRIFCFPGKHFTAITWAGGYLWSADAWDNKIYKHNTDDNFTILETYPAPGTAISGMAFDGKNIWTCDSSAGMIYRHALDTDLTVEDAFESPGASPSGLFFDGKNLWSVDSKTNRIYRHRMDASLSVEQAYIPPLYDQKNYNLSGIAMNGDKVWACSEKQGRVFSFPKGKMQVVK
jgi:sugar lactone lactonase YvrE